MLLEAKILNSSSSILFLLINAVAYAGELKRG